MKKYTILIVEDEEINYIYLETLICERFKLDSAILHARNGKEAIDICKNNPKIDLVLMDLKMPVMDGFEATRLIREFRPDLPVVAETAYSLREDMERALLAGCNDFISKPLSIECLYGIIVKYLIINNEDSIVYQKNDQCLKK